MNIDIRKSIKNNFQNSDESEIFDAIDTSIKEKDEITLPGLGVFFEITWENSDKQLKDKIINILINNIKNQG